MKKITLNNREYWYNVLFGEDFFTKFYTKTVKKRKKYYFFGKEINVDDYTHAFTFTGDVNFLSMRQKDSLLTYEQNYNNLINELNQDLCMN